MSLFETKEKMLRALDTWSSKTYGEALSEIIVTDENRESVNLLKIVVKNQGLENKPMDGFSAEGLKKAEFERMGVCYVDFFNILEESGEFWTPLDCIHEICKNNLSRKDFYNRKAMYYNMSFEKVTYLMCGRMLRALPSYIREYQLKNELKEAFSEAVFYQDEDMDKRFHCDLKMELNEQSYYFWSFVSSKRGLSQFMDKFKDNRYGVVLDGSHVLCPFNWGEQVGSAYHGWCFYSSDYIESVKTAVFDKSHISYYEILNSSMINAETFHHPVVVDKNAFSLADAV